MNNEHKISRRKIIGGLGSGIAALAAAPVLMPQAKQQVGPTLCRDWKIRLPNIQNHLSKSNPRHGRAYQLIWIPSRITGKPVTRVQAG